MYKQENICFMTNIMCSKLFKFLHVDAIGLMLRNKPNKPNFAFTSNFFVPTRTVK